jgi:DNA polymerase II small subunit
MLTKAIFDIFMKRNTLLHPDAINYIQNKPDPLKYVNNLVEKLQDFPLVLTMKDIENVEDSSFIHTSKSDGSTPQIEKDSTSHELDKSKETGKEQIGYQVDHTRLATKSEKQMSTSSIKISKLQSDTSFSGALMTRDIGKDDFGKESLQISESINISSKVGSLVEDSEEKAISKKPEIDIILDITGKSTCEGKIKDFSRNIKYKFSTLKNIIRTQNRFFSRPYPLEKINFNYVRDLHLIGIVTEASTTSKGNTILSMEDESGEVKVFINKDKVPIDSKILNDEILGIAGKTNTKLKMVVADRIVRPTPPRSRMINRADEIIDAVFISDIHVGSMQFMEEQWNNFIQWLRGKKPYQGGITPDNIRYLVVSGDLVDGIGIYPSQEEELSITNIYEQYSRLAELLAEVPDHLKIILAPGNHDAVRQAEPQPALSSEFHHYFSKNTVFIGNPCYFSLQGVEVLLYHGRSFDDTVKYIPEATYKNPIKPMKEMMIRRHLVPIYGERTPIAPEHRDYLIIDRLPDIFVTGHVHTAGSERVNDILFINASAWQAQTSYQKTLNFNPDPCKAFLVNLNSVRATELDFSQQNF